MLVLPFNKLYDFGESTMAAGAIKPLNGQGSIGVWDRLGSIPEKESVWMANKCFFTPLGIAMKWKGVLGYPLSPTESAALAVGETGKNVIGAAELPEKVTKFGHAAVKFVKDPTLHNLKDAAIKGCSIGGPVNDAMDLAKRFFSVPTPITQFWSAVGPVTLFFGVGDMAVSKYMDLTRDVANIADSKLHEAKTPKEFKERETVVTQALRRMVKTVADLAFAISYVALAVILFATFWTGALVVSPWVLPAISTIALATTLFSKFYEKIVIFAMPENAQKVPENHLTAPRPTNPKVQPWTAKA